MAELIAFLYIARGSAGEVRSMVALLERLDRGDHELFADLKLQVIDVSRQLGAWIGSLENSSVKGSRSLTRDARIVKENTQRRDDFLDQLRRIQAGEQNSLGDREKLT